LLVSPMLAEDISRVQYTIDVYELQQTGRDSFTYPVKRQSLVALVQFRVRERPTVNMCCNMLRIRIDMSFACIIPYGAHAFTPSGMPQVE
jgi:hypothetical protein